MADSDRQALLPVDKEIELDNRRLTLQERLSAGLTGEVYKGQLVQADESVIPVAVKAMRPLSFAVAEQLFREEGGTLSKMRYLEEEANKQQRLALRIAPEYYGLHVLDGINFLIMEFIQGKTVPDLLSQTGNLPEWQALTIGWHLYRTLDIMHTHLNKSYVDLKFENLWWVARDNGGQLKLTDFGTLEDIKDSARRGVQRDVLLGAVYLCAMLTGYTLKYSLGHLQEEAEPIIRRDAGLSWGTLRLLLRLLHRNPDVRPKSAAEIAGQLRNLVNFWQTQPADKLFNIAENRLDLAEGGKEEEVLEHASLGRAALGIAEVQLGSSERLEALIARADGILIRSDYLGRGQALFNGRSYGSARKAFRDGMEWSDNPAVLRRWDYSARMAEDLPAAVFDPHREEIIKIVELLNKRHWEAASERLSLLPETLNSTGLTALQADVELFIALTRAVTTQSKDYQASATAYRQALAAANRLPDDDPKLVQQREVGHLLTLAQDQEALNETAGKAQREMDALIDLCRAQREGVDVRQIQEKTAAAFYLDRDNLELQEKLRTLVEIALDHGDFSLAGDLASISYKVPRRLSDLDTMIAVARPLVRTEEALREGRRSDALTDMKEAYTLLRQAGKKATPALDNLLQQAQVSAIRADDDAFLESLADFEEQLSLPDRGRASREQAQGIRRKRTVAMHQQVDRLLAEATGMMALDDAMPEEAWQWPLVQFLSLLKDRLVRWQKIKALTEAAVSLANVTEHRQDAARQLDERAGKTLAEAQAETSRREQSLQTIIQSGQQRTLLSQQEQLKQQLDEADEIADLEQQLAIKHSLDSNLRSLIFGCYDYLVRVNKDDTEIAACRAWALENLDRIGRQGWRSLQQTATTRLERWQADLAAAQAAFAGGDNTAAGGQVDALRVAYYDDPTWQSLHNQVRQVEEWQRWKASHAADLVAAKLPEMMSDLRRFWAYGLPVPYWRSADVADYLGKLRQAAFVRLEGRLFTFRSDREFVPALRSWLEASWLEKVARGEAPTSEQAWDTEGFFKRIYHAAASKDANNLHSELLKTAMPLPAELQTTLNQVNETTWQKVMSAEHSQTVPPPPPPRWYWLAAGVAILFFLGTAAVFGIYAINNWGGGDNDAEETRQAEIILQTETAVAALAGLSPTAPPTPIITPSPSSTPPSTPTFTPSPTLTSTPTETPSPTPTIEPPENSAFFLSDPAALAATIPISIPAGADLVWRIPIAETWTVAEPPFSDETVWTADELSNGEPFYYIEEVADGTTVTVTWTMDKPVDAGLYQLHVLDSVVGSAQAQTYTILLDGQPAVPYRGESSIIFDDNVLGDQEESEWLSLGFYEVTYGQTIIVQAATTGPRFSFPATPLLLSRVTPEQRVLLDGLPTQRTLVSLLDENRVTYFYQAYDPAPAVTYSYRETTLNISSWSNTLAWNGVYSSRSFDPIVQDREIRAEWAAAGRLPAGEYMLMAWIPPEHATVYAGYTLSDGQEIDPEPPVFIQQQDFAGQWVELNRWTLSEEQAVDVLLIVARNLGQTEVGEIGVDAVALLRVGP